MGAATTGSPARCSPVKAAPVAVQYSVPAATVPVVHTAPVVQHIGYNVHHQVHHVPQDVINHAPVVGAFTGLHHLAGLPVVAAPVAAPAAAPVEAEAEAPAVEMA